MAQVLQERAGFRNDINGLRAWAVLAVILFHFGIPGFHGGFVGVDIFFVISGNLMTGIVVSGLERNSFSILHFYLARARRIFPAVIVLCAILLAGGWWVLPPPDFESLGTHVVASLGIFTNIRYAQESGYFDTDAHTKWLLHTWSLAVEWQFYLLLPVTLAIIWKIFQRRSTISALLIVLWLASFIASIVMTQRHASEAFFLLTTRAWEILTGSLVYLLAQKKSPDKRGAIALEVLGVAMILVSITAFDGNTPWPGWLATIPVLGAAAVLTAARPHSIWTGASAMQWLGRCSYSLYLWHWPIVVALAYLGRREAPDYIAVGIVLTLMLGHLSYRLVESPARTRLGQLLPIWTTVILVAALLAVATPAAWIKSQGGVVGRLPEASERNAREVSNVKPRRDDCFLRSGTESPSCIYGGSRLSAILIGDSHADAVTTALAAAVPNAQDGIMDWSYMSCPTLFGVKYVSPESAPGVRCTQFLNWAMGKLATVPTNVPLVIVNRTTAYAFGDQQSWRPSFNKPVIYFSHRYTETSPESLKEFQENLIESTCQLAKDRPVYLVRPFPEMDVDVPKAMSRLPWNYDKDFYISMADYRTRHAFVWAAQDAASKRCGVKILDPLPYLCPDDRCHAAKDGRPIYYDDNHLSEYGNKLLVPMFAQVFNNP